MVSEYVAFYDTYTSFAGKANLQNIFVSPYPTLFLWYGSVGKLFCLTSQIPYPLNLIVNSPTIGNKTKCTNDAN